MEKQEKTKNEWYEMRGLLAQSQDSSSSYAKALAGVMDELRSTQKLSLEIAQEISKMKGFYYELDNATREIKEALTLLKEEHYLLDFGDNFFKKRKPSKPWWKIW